MSTDRRTESARKVPDLALREALAHGHNYIGTEHYLLALIKTGGTASRILVDLGVGHSDVSDHMRTTCPTCGQKTEDHGSGTEEA